MAEVVGGISGLTRKYLPVPQAADVGKYLKVDTNGNPVYYAETPGGVVTAEGAAVANDAGAAVGATTALKLANLTENASTAQEGVSEFATAAEIVTGTDDTRAVNVKQLKDSLVLDGMWLTKRTKMPDGATAVFANDDWTNLTGITFSVLSPSSGSVSNGEITITPSTMQGRMMITGAVAGKIIALRAKRPSTAAAGFKVWGYDGSNLIGSPMLDIALGTSYQIFVLVVPIGATSVRVYPDNVAGSAPATIDWLWIGDYSYLDGSLSEEAARIANELGDTPGVGVAASGTITATDLATAGKGDTIHGKKYTFVDALTASPGVEGEVLKAATKEEEIENENLAISEVSRANNGVKYWAAAVHPLVSTTRSGAVLNISAKTPGLAGNQITVVSESGTNHTASGSTLSGGKDAVGDKIHTQLQTMPATTSKYGAALLAADGGTTGGTVVQADDSRLAKAPVSWTPVPKFGGVADDGTFAITANNSIEIGKFVHIEAVLTWTVKGSKTGTFTLTGAPVAGILPGTFKVIGSAYVSTGGLSIPSALQVAFDGGSFVLISQGATGSSTITDANFTETTQIRIVGDYIAA